MARCARKKEGDVVQFLRAQRVTNLRFINFALNLYSNIVFFI
jgi:hypothetical protein